MKFKEGDKIRLKSRVTGKMLDVIGLSSSFVKGKGSFIADMDNSQAFSIKMKEEGYDVHVQFSDRGCLMPVAWIEFDKPRGHHLTNIFKD